MHSIRGLLPIKTKDINNGSLFNYFENSWNLSNILYNSCTNTQAFYTSLDPLRHPLIFYLGHTAAFYINKLIMSGLLTKRVNNAYEILFAQGVDPESSSELTNNISWPSAEEVWKYREKVHQIVSEVIYKNSLSSINDKDPLWSLFMAIEHDRIHFETSSVLLRQSPPQTLTKPQGWNYAPLNAANEPTLKMIFVEGGNVQFGKMKDHTTFGWDNEYGSLTKYVPSFLASNHLISNQEFYKFVQEKGYSTPSYWTKEGWAWKEKHQIKHPKFWLPEQASFLYRTVYDVIDLPLDWPVEVNFHEAQAYCKWLGPKKRLLTEAEFERLVQLFACHESKDAYLCSNYNLNLQYGSPRPIGTHQQNCSSNDFSDIFGNVWQWLSDDFYSLPGFKSHALYEDFSTPYFTPKHAMLKGGSWASTGASASKYYRLWFRKNFYQHAGFRLAESL